MSHVILAAQIVGFALLVTGVLMLNIPAGLIVAGAGILAFGIAWERASAFKGDA